MAGLQQQLKDSEESLRLKESRFDTVEQTRSARICELEKMLGEKEGLLQSQNADVLEKTCQLEAAQQQLRVAEARYKAEVERLTTELRLKKIELATLEKKVWHSTSRWRFWK